MPKRETVFASAILAALVPAMVLSVGLHHAQGAANNCLAKPNAAPPRGSHWYYRVDPAGNRRCWFLAPEGATPRQALSPKPAPNPPPKRASQPKATATAQPAREMDPAATYAMLSPALPTSANVADGERASASNGAAGGLAAMHPEDDMPLIGPVLSATERAAAEWPPGLAARLGPMLAYVAAALALVMIVREVFRLFAVRRLRRRRMALREQWNQELRRRVGASRSRRHSPTWSRRPAQRSTVASWLQYRASPRSHTQRRMNGIPIITPRRSTLKKACSSFCRPAGGAWRHEHARLVAPWPSPATPRVLASRSPNFVLNHNGAPGHAAW